jgi:hypothetical protein
MMVTRLYDVSPTRPVGLEGLLPRLEANLELGSLGQDRTQLAISARYRPPLGVVGRAVDRVLLHRVAEATLKDFLDRVGQAIALSQPGGAARMSAPVHTDAHTCAVSAVIRAVTFRDA